MSSGDSSPSVSIHDVLTDKFIKGLRAYRLTYDEIKNWKYCGGNTGRHLNYYNLIFLNSLSLIATSD